MITYCILLIVLDEFSAIFYKILSVGVSVVSVIDITLNLSILMLFTYKLQQIVIYTYQVYSVSNNNDKQLNDIDINLNRNQQRLITVITKQTLLGIIAIICNQFFYGSIIGGGYIKDFDAMDAYYLICSNGIRIFEGTVNCVVLYLNFSINQNHYYKICGICHDRLYRCCVRKTKHKIVQNSVSDDYQLLDIT
eukprot:448721_1